MDGRDARVGGSGAARPPVPAAGTAHQVVLRGREEATIGGVLHVSSFDDHEIVLDTDLGTLTLIGHDLQIKQLDLAQGTFWVEGLIDSLAYATTRKAQGGARAQGRGGMLGRLFR